MDDDKLAELKYGHISNWDTSEVTDVSSLFLDAHEFNSPIEIRVIQDNNTKK
ncbi:BspA family leucine-rich repeat surface protein [Polaribacter sp.]|nr:BspA family leucine-rich repeat surface protein [Polaribacter sp.]